jgi:YebC/PmpR family DNA-binding regulatory protein
MSGHSHWHSIKHQKGIADAKRGQIFSKVARIIMIAVKESGPDPEKNSRLRMAMEKARLVNMPKDNVDRAIKRGAGDSEGEKLEEVSFEAFGPGGITIIIEGITDKKTRSLGEIKQILSQNGGKLSGEGAVKWMFERKGIIIINNEQKTINKEELELLVIEAGAEDIYWENDVLNIYTKPENIEEVKKNLEGKNMKIDSSSLGWFAKEEIEISEKDKAACERLFEALDENDTVQEIYSNLKS